MSRNSRFRVSRLEVHRHVTSSIEMMFLLLFTTFLSLQCAQGARILGVFVVPSYSHFYPPNELMKELARRGHEVTVIGPYEENENLVNYTKIQTTSMFPINGDVANKFEIFRKDIFENVGFLMDVTYGLYKRIFAEPKIEEFLKSKRQFDLVIIENFLSPSLHGFCHHFDAPCVVYSSLTSTCYVDPLMGNPTPLSYVSEFYLGLSDKLNFSERFLNMIHYLYTQYKYHFHEIPRQNALTKRVFPKSPDLYDILYNNSLLLLNSHSSFSSARPKMPSIIEIGGFHVKTQRKPLPEDLKVFLDSSTEGVVYFSMGSMLQSKDFPKNKLDEIVKALSQIKCKVLWKFEDDRVENLPGNVKIYKWIPQQDVLAHKHVKAFITHGGLFSTIEAVYFGVPIIGIPVFGDQKANMLSAQNKGFGIALDYGTINSIGLLSALREILYNPKYTQNAKFRSSLMSDQPLKPMKKAIFWIEHVLRTKGAPHLRPAGLDLPWYQYHLLDVITLLTVISITCVTLIALCVTKLSVKIKSIKVD